MQNKQNTTLKTLITATAGLSILAAPLAIAQGSKPGTTPGSAAQGTTQGTPQRTTQVDRAPLTTEVTETFVDGYTVPNQYRTYFTEFPEIKEENVVVRYHSGRAYYVNSKDWKIVRVVELDSSTTAGQEDSVLVEGYVIPEDRRTRFIEVPKPDEAQHVRYYNNTAYYMNSDFQIVRTVRLTPQGNE